MRTFQAVSVRKRQAMCRKCSLLGLEQDGALTQGGLVTISNVGWGRQGRLWFLLARCGRGGSRGRIPDLSTDDSAPDTRYGPQDPRHEVSSGPVSILSTACLRGIPYPKLFCAIIMLSGLTAVSVMLRAERIRGGWDENGSRVHESETIEEIYIIYEIHTLIKSSRSSSHSVYPGQSHHSILHSEAEGKMYSETPEELRIRHQAIQHCHDDQERRAHLGAPILPGFLEGYM